MNKYQYKVQGVDYDVEIVEVEGNIAKVKVNGIEFEVELKEPIHASTMPKHPIAAGAGTKVGAPLPGTITEVKVKVGDIVKAGDAVIILEAMKMQNNIEAEVSGTVSSVLVKEGDTVMEGDALITIA